MGIILPVSLAAVAAAAILNIWLSIRIGAIRRAAGISVGAGESEPLERRMRAQSNFIENTPLVLALIVVIELTGKGAPWLSYIVALYFIGRILHAYGMDGASWAWGRMVGTISTLLILLGLALWAALIAAGVL